MKKLWLRAAASLAWLALATMVLFVAPLKAQDQQQSETSSSEHHKQKENQKDGRKLRRERCRYFLRQLRHCQEQV